MHGEWARCLPAVGVAHRPRETNRDLGILLRILLIHWLRALRALADSCVLMTYVLSSYWLRALRALADCHIIKVVPRFGTSMLFGFGSKSASNKHSGVQKSLNTKKRGQTLIYLGVLLYCKKRTQSAPLLRPRAKALKSARRDLPPCSQESKP